MCINWYTPGLAIFFPITEAIWELFSQGDIFKPMLYSKGWGKMGLRHPWAFSQLTDLSRSTWQTRLHLPNTVSKDKGFAEWSSLSLHPSLHCESTIFSWAICTQNAFSETATNCFPAHCWNCKGQCVLYMLPLSWAQDTSVVSPTTEMSKNLVTCQTVYAVLDYNQKDIKKL